jgi:drug/metabolite transporter (DMT)-like permease
MTPNRAIALALLAALLWGTENVAQKTDCSRRAGETLSVARGVGCLRIILGVVIAARVPAQIPRKRNSIPIAQY